LLSGHKRMGARIIITCVEFRHLDAAQ
jgi:hypothetical protein